METIYEISKFPFPMDAIIFGLLFLGFGAYALIYFGEAKTKKKKRYLIPAIGISILTIVLLLPLFVWSVKDGGSEDYVYAREYYKGNYEIAEGEVENFTEENNGRGTISRYFSVDSVKFEQRTMFIVDEFREDSRKILHNGQKVRISYIPYEPEEWEWSGQGKIVKIEMLIEE